MPELTIKPTELQFIMPSPNIKLVVSEEHGPEEQLIWLMIMEKFLIHKERWMKTLKNLEQHLKPLKKNLLRLVVLNKHSKELGLQKIQQMFHNLHKLPMIEKCKIREQEMLA